MLKIVKKLFRFVRWHTAKYWLSLWPEVDIVGVAGSVGKTTTKELINSVLGVKFRTVKTDANWDPIFNIPISAFKTWGKCKFVVELGIDEVGQMEKYLSLVQPRISVLTRLSLEHTDDEHLTSFTTAVSEEIKSISSLPQSGWAVLNGDDNEIRKQSKKIDAQTLFYGFASDNDLKIADFKEFVDGDDAGSTFSVTYEDQVLAYENKLLGKINALNSCAAIAVGLKMGLNHEEIRQGLLALAPSPGRLAPKNCSRGLIIDDTYNASPVAVMSAIDVLIDLDPKEGILVLGDMLELGDHSSRAHMEVGSYARKCGVKELITYGNWAEKVLEGFSNKNHSYRAKTQEEIFKWFDNKNNIVVLVKGSRGMKMENVVDFLVSV